MATGTLTGQTIANTYKALLKITGTTAGGETLHATTQNVIEDGDGNPFPLSAAQDALMITSTNRLEFGTNANYIYQVGSNVLGLVAGSEIDLTATAVDLNGTLDVSGTSQFNSTITVDQDTNAAGIAIDSEASGSDGLSVSAKYAIYGLQDISGGRGVYIERNIAEAGSNPLVTFHDNNDNNTQPALKIRQDGTAADAINIDFDGTSGNCIDISTPLSDSGTCLKIQNANSLTSGSIAEFHSDSASNTARSLVFISNDNGIGYMTEEVYYDCLCD